MQFRAVGWWRCAHAVKSGVTNSPVAEGICNRLSGAATHMPTDGLAFVRANSSAAGSQAGQQSVQSSLLVNTLDMMRNFEKLGMTREQSERLTRDLTEILCINKDKIAAQFVSKSTLEKAVLEQEARIAGFKSEVQKSQELHHSSLTRDTDRLQTMLDKVKAEIRYEIDKLTASQRLDLNLEKGRMRDELQALRDKANELEIKMDKETNSLKAAVEQTKNETIKYCLGMMLAFTTAGLGAARLVSH